MENLNARDYNTHSDPNDINGIVTDKIETLYNLARKYLKEVKSTTYYRLAMQIIGDLAALGVACTLKDCIDAIDKLKHDRDIIFERAASNKNIDGSTDTMIRYEEPKKKNPRDDSLPAYIECIRFLRSKFPNMIIDLEPEITSSTCATANKLVITNKKCPVCGELMYADTGLVLTSNPPQYRFICKICKHTETGRHDNATTIGFGTSTVGFGIAAYPADEVDTIGNIIETESKRTGKHPADVAIDLIKKM